MLERHDIIDVDDLRRAAEGASCYEGKLEIVVRLRADNIAGAAAAESEEC